MVSTTTLPKESFEVIFNLRKVFLFPEVFLKSIQKKLNMAILKVLLILEVIFNL